jgi:hypothetical protein
MISFLMLLALALLTWFVARWRPSLPQVEDPSEESFWKWDDARQLAATKLGGECHLADGSIGLHILDHPARLYIHSADPDLYPIILLLIEAPDRWKGTLEVLPCSEWSWQPRELRRNALPVGEEGFDAQYLVKAAPASLANDVFAPRRRDRTIAAIRSLSPYLIELNEKFISVSIRSRLSDIMDLSGLVERVAPLLRCLLETDPIVESSEGESLLSVGGNCQVCGTAMTAEIVFCARCRTPHHEECWSYAGSCATYACGESRSLSIPDGTLRS